MSEALYQGLPAVTWATVGWGSAILSALGGLGYLWVLLPIWINRKRVRRSGNISRIVARADEQQSAILSAQPSQAPRDYRSEAVVDG